MVCITERVKLSFIDMKTPGEKGIWAWLRVIWTRSLVVKFELVIRYPSKDLE